VEAVSKESFARKRFLDDYKGIHVALEVKFFIDSLRLRRVPVRGSAIGSLNLPLIIVIGIVGREREGSPAHKRSTHLLLRLLLLLVL
jgi:hypothetical protein